MITPWGKSESYSIPAIGEPEESVGQNELDKHREKLKEFLDALPDREGGTKTWSLHRSMDLDEYGKKSILSIFPEHMDKDTTQIVRVIKILARNDIRTKTDLLEMSKDGKSLPNIKGIGEKSLELIWILRGIVRAERDSE